MNLSFVMNAILNLSLSLFRIVLNLVPERVSSSSLAIHGRRETVTLAKTTAKTALDIKKAFFQILSHLFRHTLSRKCR